MELTHAEGRLRNAFGERVNIEDDCLFPLLKSADLASGRVDAARRWVIIPQRHLGQETDSLRAWAPKTWRYLDLHRNVFEHRASSVYRGKPPFSVFGVGDYTFAPWKVAIAGLYKSLRFCVVPPIDGKPVIFDDTCYFLPRRSAQEARATHALLDSEAARQFFDARVWWGDKRPITKDLLERLDLGKLASLVAIDATGRTNVDSPRF
jgi:hypothetical protein